MLRRFVLALAVPALAGCGGGSSGSAPFVPTAVAPSPSPAPAPSPSAPAGQALPVTVADGVSGASVEAAVSPAGPLTGTAVSVAAAGYLLREQVFDGATIFLWPGSEAYVRELVYDWEFSDGVLRMVRWDAPFTISFEGDLAQDGEVLARAGQVAAEMSRVTGLPIAVGGSGGAVLIRVDPSILQSDDAVGQAQVSFRGGVMARATVRFVSRAEILGGPGAQYGNTLLHELGHVLGLGHSPDPADVMTPGEGPGTEVDLYQAGEAGCLNMMYRRRRPGNLFPDRDPPAGSLGVGPLQTVVITDRYPQRPRR